MTEQQDDQKKTVETAFVREYPVIFRFMMRSVGDRPTAEDLCQDVFMRALEQRQTFRDKGAAATGGWLKAIARSTILMRKRREEAGDRARERLKTEPFVTRPPSPEEVVEEHDFQVLCAALRAALPEDVRTFMRVWAAQRAGSLSAPEAAEILGIWVQKYEAEKKRVRRMVLRTAQELEEGARVAREAASIPTKSAE